MQAQTSKAAAGGCHCGNIRYELGSEVPLSSWAARYCGCGYCTRHGALYASHPSAVMSVAVKRSELLGSYSFATASADFCFCKQCGVLTYLTSDIDGHLFGLVNVNTLADRPAEFARSPVMSYAGEAPNARLQRRKQNWIARVQIHLTA